MKIYRIFTTATMVLSSFSLLFLLCGCCFFGSGNLHLTEKDSGKTFEISTGSFVTITLPANPTTGYLWTFASPVNDSVLALCSDNILTPTGEKKVLGAGGKRILKYEVISPGKAAVNLKYVRPWEYNTPPSGIFQVILYCVGKAKNAPDEEIIITPRRDQHGNDIPRKRLFDR